MASPLWTRRPTGRARRHSDDHGTARPHRNRSHDLQAMPPGGTMTTTTRLSTSDVDARDGFGYWADAVSSTFVPLECSTTLDRPFNAELVSIGVGDLQLTRITAASHRVARTRRTIRRDDPEMIKVSLQIRGTAWISQDGRDAVLADGDLTMYDTSRPYTLMFDEHRQYSTAVVMFPANLLGIPV